MATITTRSNTDGATRYRVEFREGGRAGRKRVGTFSDAPTAARFKALVEALGNVWPDDHTLTRAGFAMLIESRPARMVTPDITLVDYATAHLDTLECGKQTRKSYAAHIRDYLAPWFNGEHGPARLADIERGHMRAWQHWMTGEKGLSAKTVGNVRGLLIPVFAAACLRGEYGEPPLLEYSPMTGLRAPKKDTEPRAFLRTAEHARLFLRVARDTDPDFADLIWFMAATAARWGEATAVHADACHLTDTPAVVAVTRVARRITGEGYAIYPGAKTAAGVRELPAGPDLAAMLARRAAAAPPCTACAEPCGDRLVFGAPHGGLWQTYGNYWRDRWAPIVAAARRAGLPYDLSIHGLRKSTVTAWVKGGVDVGTVRDRAGHASAQTTLNIYTGAGGGQAHLVAVTDAWLGAA